jgi:hypothetical protein
MTYNDEAHPRRPQAGNPEPAGSGRRVQRLVKGQHIAADTKCVHTLSHNNYFSTKHNTRSRTGKHPNHSNQCLTLHGQRKILNRIPPMVVVPSYPTASKLATPFPSQPLPAFKPFQSGLKCSLPERPALLTTVFLQAKRPSLPNHFTYLNRKDCRANSC